MTGKRKPLEPFGQLSVALLQEYTESTLTEHELHSSFIVTCREWSRHYPELWTLYATPNEGTRGIKEAALRHAEGMRAGIPDVCIPSSSGRFGALYIEFKSRTGTLKPAQKVICKMLALQGNAVLVSRSARRAWEITKNYLDNVIDSRFGGCVVYARPGKDLEFVPVLETLDELALALQEADEETRIERRKNRERLQRRPYKPVRK